MNTGIATFESVEDMRPYWHPFVTVQACGLAIAYCVNVATPWASPRPILRLAIAVAIGAILGHALMVPIKNFILEHLLDQPRLYTLDYLLSHKKTFFFSAFGAFLIGLCISVFFLLRFRESARRRGAAQGRGGAAAAREACDGVRAQADAGADRAAFPVQHARVRAVPRPRPTRRRPPGCSGIFFPICARRCRRCAAPSATLGQEIEFAEAYLNILKMRMGSRLDFAIDVPDSLRAHPFPPVLLISVVENAVTHGLEPLAAGGHITIAARRDHDVLRVTVTDTGIGFVRRIAAGPRRGPPQRPRAARGAVRRARPIHARGCLARAVRGRRSKSRSRPWRRHRRGDVLGVTP